MNTKAVKLWFIRKSWRIFWVEKRGGFYFYSYYIFHFTSVASGAIFVKHVYYEQL